MAAYTTTNLLTSIERQSFAPARQSTFDTTDILELADEVSKTTILPAILSAREEYYLYYEDLSITNNVAAYTIPSRSYGLTVRDVQVIDANGNVRALERTSIDRLQYMSNSSDRNSPDMFYVQGDQIVLVPTPNATQSTLRLYYFLRPSSFVETSDAAVISTINTSTNIVTVSTIPSSWVTGDTFDLIQGKGGHRHLSIELISTLVSGTSITLPSLPTGLAVGDYITLAGQTPVVQMPPDFQPILATLVAAEMLLSMSQPRGEKVLAKALRNLGAVQKMLTPRVVGKEEIILPDWS